MKLHVVSLKKAEAVDDQVATAAPHGIASDLATPLQVRSQRIRNGYAYTSLGDLIAGVPRHSRYLSEFSDNVIRLDVSHHQSIGTNVTTIDLQNQLVGCNGGRSHYSEPQPLRKFPEAVDALKVALNRTLERCHKGAVDTAISETMRAFLRIFVWMGRNCIFRFSDLNRELVSELVCDVALNAWHGALEQTETLRGLMSRMRADIDVFEPIYNRYRNGKNYSIPIEKIESMVGVPIYEWAIPRSIYEEFATLEDDKRQITKQNPSRKPGASLFAIQDLMAALNALALSTPGSITFLPFPEIEKASNDAFLAAQKILKKAKSTGNPNLNELLDWEPSEAFQAEEDLGEEDADGEVGKRPTVNLTVHECARIFSEALRWTYDYAPTILKTLSLARSLIGELAETDSYAQQKAWQKVYAFYEAEAANTGLPIKSIEQRNLGAQSLRKLVKMLQYALFVNFGINSARRVNELLGLRGAPYGLYLGALSKVHDEPAIYRVDAYVSKGPMDWFSFPANKLMADAYFVLEELYKLHEPYDAEELPEDLPLEEARKRKLFTSRGITPIALSAAASREEFNSSERDDFLELAGVDPQRFARCRTPFRRMFSTLFMHRYDLREFAALQTYLGHLDAATTGGYFNDLRRRAPGESIRELHAPDFVDKDLIEELDKSSLEYMAEQLLRMLNGEEIGGGFPAVVAKLARELSSGVGFAELSAELKSDLMAKHLHEAGHRCSAMKHGCCMAGQAKETGEAAKCFHDGALHHEEASSKKCGGCVHLLANDSYIQNVEDQISASEAAAARGDGPAAVQQAHERRIFILRSVVATERRAGRRNKKLFAEAQSAWEATVARRLEPRADASNQGHA